MITLRNWLLKTIVLLVSWPAIARVSPLITTWENFTSENGLPSDRVSTVVVDGDTVWVGTDRGLVLIKAGAIQRIFTTTDGLPSSVVTGVTLDGSRGDLWIATFGGLSRFSGGEFQNYSSLSTGLANDMVYAVALQGEFVWAATASGISRLSRLTGSWSIYNEGNLPVQQASFDGIAVHDKKVYFASWGSGVLEYDSSLEQWQRLDDADHRRGSVDRSGSKHAFVSGVSYDRRDGVLWVSTFLGLSSFDGNHWNYHPSKEKLLPSDLINATQAQGNGEVWVCTDRGLVDFDLKTHSSVTYRPDGSGTGGGEVVVLNSNNRARTIRTATSLAGRNVMGIAFHGDEVWVATDAGLSHGRRPVRQDRRMIEGVSSPQPIIREVLPKQPAALIAETRNSRKSETVNIGLLGPIEGDSEKRQGLSMFHGAQLAIEEANAAGGYSPWDTNAHKLYALKTHGDSDLWDASLADFVRVVTEEHVVSVLGPIDGVSSHALLRASMELGLPMLNTATTDPTVAKTGIPWLVQIFPDDQQQARNLARYIVEELKLKRIGFLRANTHNARSGAAIFSNEAARYGHLSMMENEFEPNVADISAKLRGLQNARVEGVVIWGEPSDAALVLKEMKMAGMGQPVFGPSQLASSQLLELAGTAAEGLVTTCMMDLGRSDSTWRLFEERYRRRFDEPPDAYGVFAYDALTILIPAIQKARQDPKLIMEALREFRFKKAEGVSGRLRFDRELNNIAPLTLARVEGGRFKCWVLRPNLDTAEQKADPGMRMEVPKPSGTMEPSSTIEKKR